MSDELKLYLICFTRNVISLICFTILSIAFHKWWLIFFALIFWCSVEKNEGDK
jgi:hypothetical protein